MATVLDSLLVALGYEFDDEGLDEFNKSVDTVTDKINDLTVAAGLMAAAFIGVNVASAASDDSLAKQARTIGIAVEELDSLRFAAEQTTGSSDGLGGSLQSLASNLGEAARGAGGALEAFGILGVSATDAEGNVRGVNEVLLESADALNRLGSESQRLELASKLGLGDLTLLLREGSVGIRRLQAEAVKLGVATQENTDAAEAFNDQWNRLVRVSRQFVREIATKALPIFTDLLKTFQEWSEENEEIIASGLETFLNAVAFALKNIQFIMLAIISLKFAAFILKTAVAIQKMGSAALIAQIKLFAIVIAIAAIIAIIALVIEDFIVFQEGGDSAIGRLLDKFPLLGFAFEKIGEAIVILRGLLTDFFELVAIGIDKIGDGFKAAQDVVSSFFDSVEAGFKRVKRVFEAIKGFIGSGVDATKGFLSDAADFITGNNTVNVNGGGQVTGAPFSAPAALASSVTNANRSTNIGSVSITVDGGDPNKVRQTILEVFNGEIQQASNNASSVVVG